jgi:hypothetical protein
MSGDLRKRQAIDRLVAAAEHIRDCERCRRVYSVAFDIVLEALREEYRTLYWEYPPPFTVLEHASGNCTDASTSLLEFQITTLPAGAARG